MHQLILPVESFMRDQWPLFATKRLLSMPLLGIKAMMLSKRKSHRHLSQLALVKGGKKYWQVRRRLTGLGHPESLECILFFMARPPSLGLIVWRLTQGWNALGAVRASC
jgi:hypothetical protein